MKLVIKAAMLVAAGLSAFAACSDEFTTGDPDSSGAGGDAEGGKGGDAGSSNAGSGGESGAGGKGGSGARGGESGSGGDAGSRDAGSSGSGGLAGEGGGSGKGGGGGSGSGGDGATAGSGGSSGDGGHGAGGSSGQAGEGGGGGSTGECAADDDCADGEACNGDEVCDGEACEPGDALKNGTACQGEGAGVFFCQNAECVESTCGDKIVDVNAGEECDDGNDVDTDGCKNDCKFTCTNDAACSDNEPCNGVELCVSHLCAPGTNAELGTACTGGSSASHICDGKGECVASVCGDGYFDPSAEECEEEGGPNGNDADGCTDECQYTCEIDEDCKDADLCDGTEKCDIGTHTCKEGDPLVCTDKYLCTTNERCEADVGCQSDLVDEDKDGFPPNLGETSCVYNGKLFSGSWWDCNDNDKEAIPNRDYYADCDGDGYTPPSSTVTKTQSCGRPANPPPNCAKGQWFVKVTALKDCNDDKGTNPAYFRPGQTEYSSNNFGGPNYDFNCDGTELQKERTPANEPACKPTNCFGTGWFGDGSIPRCGEAGTWFACAKNGTECASRKEGNMKQQCL